MSSPVTVCHQEFDESHFLASEYEPAQPEQAAFHIIPCDLCQAIAIQQIHPGVTAPRRAS